MKYDSRFTMYEKMQNARKRSGLFVNRKSIFVNQQPQGFTLVEMIVSVAIFMFVMVIAIGSLVSIIGADRKAQSIQSVADNLQFALDDMSRSVRTGIGFSCSPPEDTYGNCPL